MKFSIQKLLKNNGKMFFCFVLLGLILVLAFRPDVVMSATFAGLTVWAKIVLPSLFCFFILTKILMQQEDSFKIFGWQDKFFAKAFGVKNFGAYVFSMSAITGYPVGAKLIFEFFSQNLLTKTDAKKMISFCSTSGPMFVIGSVGVAMFGSFRLGMVVFAGHILSAILNGLFYRKIGKIENFTEQKSEKTLPKIEKQTLNDIMLNTIISVLMIGGYISICFAVLEFVTGSKLFEWLGGIFENLSGTNIFESITKGLVEVTNGCVSLASSSISARMSAVILCSLISFGGLSIHMQTMFFLLKIGISYKYFLLTKTTQTLLAIGLSFVLSLLLL
jgi:sporulation integral membrane protein YlbJ